MCEDRVLIICFVSITCYFVRWLSFLYLHVFAFMVVYPSLMGVLVPICVESVSFVDVSC
jgi:hypothetical protein